MPQEKRRCGDCRFAEPIDATQKRCRRAAPSNGADYGSWPRVLLDDWCYQFEKVQGSIGTQPATSRASQYGVITAGHRTR
jgi:hypothetical protein